MSVPIRPPILGHPCVEGCGHRAAERGKRCERCAAIYRRGYQAGYTVLRAHDQREIRKRDRLARVMDRLIGELDDIGRRLRNVEARFTDERAR